MGLLDILKGPVAGLFNGVIGIIDRIKGGSPEEKNAAILALTQLQTEFESKIAVAQRDIIVAEAQGASWLQRNWRPIIMMFFALIIGTVVWTGGFVNGHELNHDFLMEILSIIKIGLGGYVIGRSAEKIAPQVATIFKK